MQRGNMADIKQDISPDSNKNIPTDISSAVTGGDVVSTGELSPTDTGDNLQYFNKLGQIFINGISKSSGRGDFIMALGVVAILVILIIPMPTWMLDLSLAFSITFSVMILMTVIFLDKPLEFTAFPTVLLLATL